ncbi:dehydrogenase reductase SDR family protein 7-like [Nesidiocoris tenuis]|uniref:Dehydrogenase reductase SDR family protein 7-like n=1 Tax=Nesidiocoris tenuis TaxID=355587 RepID=A0ABN7AUN7_9HEMI|nr:dehydrogenase reductase SDR family protein 7-like [Nesidiocoris tenuis]
MSSFRTVLQYLLSIFGSALLPLAIPWAIYLICRSRRIRSLEGKVVLITGASSGLGEALAHAFYACGCKIILAARRSKELERVRDDLLSLTDVSNNCAPAILTMDLGDVDSMVEKASNAESIFGCVDILVNNAGISYRGRILDTTMAVHSKVMDVNYFGQVALTKGLLPNMIGRKSGHIVTISSVQGKIALPHRSAYSASKHALQAFMDSLRAEVASEGVNVTVVSPGYIKTNLSENAVTGSGSKYGVMDETTSKGYEPSVVAQKIVSAVRRSEPELTIADISARGGIFLRSFLPTIYFLVMRIRARKMQVESSQDKKKDSNLNEFLTNIS